MRWGLLLSKELGLNLQLGVRDGVSCKRRHGASCGRPHAWIPLSIQGSAGADLNSEALGCSSKGSFCVEPCFRARGWCVPSQLCEARMLLSLYNDGCDKESTGAVFEDTPTVSPTTTPTATASASGTDTVNRDNYSNGPANKGQGACAVARPGRLPKGYMLRVVPTPTLPASQLASSDILLANFGPVYSCFQTRSWLFPLCLPHDPSAIFMQSGTAFWRLSAGFEFKSILSVVGFGTCRVRPSCLGIPRGDVLGGVTACQGERDALFFMGAFIVILCCCAFGYYSYRRMPQPEEGIWETKKRRPRALEQPQPPVPQWAGAAPGLPMPVRPPGTGGGWNAAPGGWQQPPNQQWQQGQQGQQGQQWPQGQQPSWQPGKPQW